MPRPKEIMRTAKSFAHLPLLDSLKGNLEFVNRYINILKERQNSVGSVEYHTLKSLHKKVDDILEQIEDERRRCYGEMSDAREACPDCRADSNRQRLVEIRDCRSCDTSWFRLDDRKVKHPKKPARSIT